ncbi:hypothetical protein GCK32_001629 [Trichostrongylus colubriformis]|uniref:Uncharacterized protein n=1 Tax=Trichostrongylus colubriformis TaxID=6319 RepID=A0AAN8FKH8_TRICO
MASSVSDTIAIKGRDSHCWMANPSNAIPQKVGFPQAFGSTPYQHAAQFPQFGQSQASVTNPRINEAPRSAFQVPPMSTIPPGVPQFPAMSSQTSNTQMVNGFPQNRNVAPPIARADCNGPSSAFKPYDTTSGQTVPIPPFPGPSMAPQPPINPFTPAQGVPPPVQHVTTKPLHQSTFGGTASVLYQNSSYNSNAHVGPASPPFPPALASHSSTSTSTPMQAPVSQPPAPPNLHQVQQSFSHMSINAHPAMPQQVNPAWSGSHRQDPRFAAQLNAPDLIDLTAERNVIQLGFDDNEYDLPHNMANNSARVDPSVFRCTLTVVPQTDELLKKSRLPLGLTLHPFRDMKNLNIIQTSTIVRCRYCRTYINPYVYLPDSRHWKCNLCNRNNDLPDDFCWDPNTKSFGDPVNRPEIKHPTVEFIAPNEYMLRPPQPAVYVFVLDVSAAAVEAGYIYTFSEQLLINLDQLPGDDRTQVAFVCVDSMVHFYQFSSGSRRLPRELVVDEVDEMFLPSHQGILIPLKKNADVSFEFVCSKNSTVSVDYSAE